MSTNAVVIGAAIYSRIRTSQWSQEDAINVSAPRNPAIRVPRQDGLPIASNQVGATEVLGVTYNSDLTRIISWDEPDTELHDVGTKSR